MSCRLVCLLHLLNLNILLRDFLYGGIALCCENLSDDDVVLGNRRIIALNKEWLAVQIWD